MDPPSNFPHRVAEVHLAPELAAWRRGALAFHLDLNGASQLKLQQGLSREDEIFFPSEGCRGNPGPSADRAADQGPFASSRQRSDQSAASRTASDHGPIVLPVVTALPAEVRRVDFILFAVHDQRS